MYASRTIHARNDDAELAAEITRFWADLSQPIAHTLRSQKICIVAHDLAGNRGEIVHSTGLDTALDDRYRSVPSAQNLWLRALHSSEPGTVHIGTELVPNWELVATGFYRQWMRPQSVLHGLIGVIARSRDTISCLLALREASDMPFASSDKTLLKSFLPELLSASDIVAEIASLQQFTAILLDLIEEIPGVAMIVDQAARPILLNDAAQALLVRPHGLTLLNGVVVCASPNDTRRLHAAIAAPPRQADARRPCESVVIGRETGDPPLVLQVVSLAHGWRDAAGRDVAPVAVFVAPAAQADALEGCLRFYGMTPAETRLAVMIIGGRPLLEVARDLHITWNTARTHMKHIYAKTETHSQAALVRLLMTAPGE